MRTKRQNGLQQGATLMLAVALACGFCLNTAHASWITIDDFQSYDTGEIRANGDDVTGGNWIAHDNAGLAEIAQEGDTKYIAVGATGTDSSDRRVVSTALDSNFQLGVGDGTATYYMRVRSATTGNLAIMGLGIVNNDTGALTGNFDDFLARGNITDDGDVNYYDGSGPTGDTQAGINEWVNIWIVADRSDSESNGTFDFYMTTGLSSATASDKLNASPVNLYGSGTIGSIILMGRGGEDLTSQMSYVAFSEETNLTFIPEPSTGGLLILGLAAAAAAFRRRLIK